MSSIVPGLNSRLPKMKAMRNSDFHCNPGFVLTESEGIRKCVPRQQVPLFPNTANTKLKEGSEGIVNPVFPIPKAGTIRHLPCEESPNDPTGCYAPSGLNPKQKLNV